MRNVAIRVVTFVGVGGVAFAFACGGASSSSGGPDAAVPDAVAPDVGAEDASVDTSGYCTPGETRSCTTCPSNDTGTQTCTDTGWSGCYCVPREASFDGPAVCGDGICSGDETCETCPVDCGQCVPCSLAPSCTNGASLPATLTPLSAFDCNDTDGGVPRCGVGVDAGPPIQNTDCLAPQLKIGLADIRVILNGVSDTLDMFCIISADDGHSSELIITPEETGINDHAAPILVPSAQGTFWGLDKGPPMLSMFPITINYACFDVVSNTTWENVLSAIASAAGTVATVPGDPYGWVFGAASAAAAAAEAGLQATDGNSLRFDYQQTIDPSAFLEMTNGKTWTVEQSGDVGGYNWDWALDLQSWGCSERQ